MMSPVLLVPVIGVTLTFYALAFTYLYHFIRNDKSIVLPSFLTFLENRWGQPVEVTSSSLYEEIFNNQR